MKHTSCLKDLYCPSCGNRYDDQKPINLCQCGSPLLADYDFTAAAHFMNKNRLSLSAPLWQFAPILPIRSLENIVALGEGGTPTLSAKNIGTKLGLKNLFIKDESVCPTGSFKARGMALAVSKAKELGLKKLITPTAGNAGSALAAYSARAGISCRVVMPQDSPSAFVTDCRYHGAQIDLVEGSIKDASELVAQLVKSEGWFSVATLKEPYRIEGKKTMGYELALAFDYELPDVIIYPTGGGTGLIGMWKAFDEMEKLGWIGSKRPRMVVVQSEGCAPMVRAFERKQKRAELWQNPQTLAAGLRVPGAIGDFLILEAVYKSGGCAVAVSEKEIIDDVKDLASSEGIFAAPEGGAALAGLKKLLDLKLIESDEQIVVFNTGSGYKYLEVLTRM